jgi:hypothetical protein
MTRKEVSIRPSRLRNPASGAFSWDMANRLTFYAKSLLYPNINEQPSLAKKETRLSIL